MSWKNHPIVDLIGEGLVGLIKDAWKSISGDDKLDNDLILKIKDELLENLNGNFQAQISELSVKVGLLELNDRIIDVLDAFEVKGTFPKLGIDVEELKEEKEGDQNKEDLNVYDLAEKVADGRVLSKAAYIEIAKELLRLRPSFLK